jgi:hypothetical protein
MKTLPALYVIYRFPLDYPGLYVCRIYRDDGQEPVGYWPDQKPYAFARDLEGIRLRLPAGLCNIGRYANDDPVIVEVWL